MALTIITTPGAVDANSYGDLAEASLYFEAVRDFTEVWEVELGDEDRKRRLVESTRAIDRLRNRFEGDKVDCETPQALEFPRNIQTDPLIITPNVKRAQFEMIILLHANPALTTDGANVTTNSEGPQQLRSVAALSGLIAVVFSDRREQSSLTEAVIKQGSPEAVLAELGPFLRAGASGSNFAFIK